MCGRSLRRGVRPAIVPVLGEEMEVYPGRMLVNDAGNDVRECEKPVRHSG